MTEQERPRTLRSSDVCEGMVQDAYAAGLAEGRQQAVREIRDRLAALSHQHTDFDAACIPAYEADVVNAILDRVAGLNASESPPTHGNRRVRDARGNLGPMKALPAERQPGVSESGQPPEASDE